MTLNKKIIIFVNGLPINKEMDEIIESYNSSIDILKKNNKKYSDYKIELCFNTFNCKRTQKSGAKWGRMDAELKNTYSVNSTIDNLNIFDIKLYNNEIKFIEKKLQEYVISNDNENSGFEFDNQEKEDQDTINIEDNIDRILDDLDI